MKRQKLEKWQGTACVIGLDFGDSGKGRLIDELSQNAHLVARYSGGSNTGHTVKNRFGKFALHIIPSGIFNQKALCLIGRNVAVDLESLIEDEFAQLKKANLSWKNLVIDPQATLTMPYHKLRDALREKSRGQKIGTTGRGVGPTYADRTERIGLQVKDLLKSDFKEKLHSELSFQNNYYQLKLSFSEIYKKYQNFRQIIKKQVAPTIPILQQAFIKGKNILFEGTQGWLLDLDSGTYPYVTSSNVGVIGIWRCFDLPPNKINLIIGISKAYLTRVGSGPFPTKINTNLRQIIIEKGQEVGTTSGRIRDPGWLDLVILKSAINANLVNALSITKLDILTGIQKIKICVAYKNNGKAVDYLSGDAQYLANCQPVYQEINGWNQDISGVNQFSELPQNAQNFIKKIENYLKIQVKIITTGPQRGEIIYA